MTQHRLHVTTDEQQAIILIDLLEVKFEEQGFAISSSELDEENNIWDVSIYVDAQDVEGSIHQFKEVLANLSLSLEIEDETLPDIDWVAKSLEGLKPITVGRFHIYGSHDSATVQPHHLPIEINAAQAFGTGHHGTTLGCLEQIQAQSKRLYTAHRNAGPILDLGTGSGILAIAAAKLTRHYVLATDIDPIAVKTARENAKLNQAAPFISFDTVNGLKSPTFKRKGPFGLIIANILARPLMKMSPDICKHLAPGGTLILSGILAEQRWKVLAAFKNQRMSHINTIWRNGWVTIVLRK